MTIPPLSLLPISSSENCSYCLQSSSFQSADWVPVIHEEGNHGQPFHLKCALKWMEINSICGLCRKPLDLEQAALFHERLLEQEPICLSLEELKKMAEASKIDAKKPEYIVKRAISNCKASLKRLIDQKDRWTLHLKERLKTLAIEKKHLLINLSAMTREDFLSNPHDSIRIEESKNNFNDFDKEYENYQLKSEKVFSWDFTSLPFSLFEELQKLHSEEKKPIWKNLTQQLLEIKTREKKLELLKHEIEGKRLFVIYSTLFTLGFFYLLANSYFSLSSFSLETQKNLKLLEPLPLLSIALIGYRMRTLQDDEAWKKVVSSLPLVCMGLKWLSRKNYVLVEQGKEDSLMLLASAIFYLSLTPGNSLYTLLKKTSEDLFFTALAFTRTFPPAILRHN